MKKKVIYVFSLILYLLIACTIVSQKIETEMCTQIEVSERRFTGKIGVNFSSSTDVLFEDEEGQHLYEVVEGTGWKIGACIQEIPTYTWSIDSYGQISIPSGRSYTIVESASRLPQKGESVMIVKVPGRTRDYVAFTDHYLLCYPEGVPKNFVLPENSKVITKSDTAVLLDMGDIVYPFFEQRAKKLSESMESDNCHIFSMTEVKSFLEQLPRVAVLVVFLLVPVLIWVCSGVMVQEASKYKDLLLVNVGIVVIFLWGSMKILGQIDLPASLMPADSIFNVSHYMQEFSLIMEAQGTLGESAQTVAILLPEVKKVIVCILGLGAFAGVAVGMLEMFIARRIRKNEEK